MKHISQNNTKIANKKDIANLLAKDFTKISTSNNYCKLFQGIKRDDLKKKLNFYSSNEENYNETLLEIYNNI